MLKNYLAAALRNLARNKLYAAINIVGLAIGFSVTILIGLFIRDEFSYDQFTKNSKDIYVVYSIESMPERAPRWFDVAPGDLVEKMRLDFPTIRALTQLVPGNARLKHGATEAMESVYWTDANLFSVLTLPVLAGKIDSAFARPDSIALTRRMARKYFGVDAPIDQTMDLSLAGKTRTMTVKAVLEDFPSHTNLIADIFVYGDPEISALTAENVQQGSGVFLASGHILVRMPSGAAVDNLRRALPAFMQRHRAKVTTISLDIKALSTIHLQRTDEGFFKPRGDRTIISALVAVALLIILIASINFVNLTTLRAATRGVEVGIRRISGATRLEVAWQFIGESLVYAVIGMAVGLMITELLLPAFNAFLNRQIAFHYWTDPQLLFSATAVTMLVGGMAGIYPALLLSGLRPAALFKSGAAASPKLLDVRQSLVVMQFAILIALIVATATLYQQKKYAVSEAFSLDRDQVFLVRTQGTNQAFENGIRNLPGVVAVAGAAGPALSMGRINVPSGSPTGSRVLIYPVNVDFGFFEFYGVKPVSGRLFSIDHGGDITLAESNSLSSARVVINAAAARLLGFKTPDSAIGKTFVYGNDTERPLPSEIIGVVPDFNFLSVRKAVNPVAFFANPRANEFLSVRFRGNNVQQVIRQIQQLGQRLGDASDHSSTFLNQYTLSFYLDITRQETLLTALTLVAVFIACFGLFGLSAFTAQRRTKEIGIRKVMGADTVQMMRLLAWQFTKPVLWANLIAWPVAAFVMNRWLQGFAYHIDLEPWLFMAATCIALMIALLTVSAHCYLVAREKPVRALRYE